MMGGLFFEMHRVNATGGRGLVIAAHDKRPRISSARVVAMCSTYGTVGTVRYGIVIIVSQDEVE